jgi:ABC-type multidrug transport system fused ATPase/permease subunit
LAVSCIGTYFEFSAAVFGLALTQALKITRALDWCIKQMAELEISMVSANRVIEYAEALECEKAMLTSTRPSANWPQHGRIQFVNLYVRYRPHLPPVLKNVNLEFHPRQRIAIVGRTGAGKSTILSVLFRLVEPTSGQILVDGLDITQIGLADLRTRLAIVPQEPVLFAGTMRFNLDPLSEHTDDALWLALEHTHMAETVRKLGGSLGLDMIVMENGDNFSIGQKQLLCLARAVLKKTSVLVLDEATANIDLENDALIQQSLRDNFSSSHTIITIAHRLNTIIDYDKVVVMRAGEVVEFDSPAVLAKNPKSLFAEMLRESSAHKE